MKSFKTVYQPSQKVEYFLYLIFLITAHMIMSRNKTIILNCYIRICNKNAFYLEFQFKTFSVILAKKVDRFKRLFRAGCWKKIFRFEGNQVVEKFIISKHIVIIPSNTTRPLIYNKRGCDWQNYNDLFSVHKHSGMSSVKPCSPVCRILLGRFNKGRCEGQEGKKNNMKCLKLRQCVSCCTIIHPGQKMYGQVLEIRILRPEKRSEILDRKIFARYTQFHEGFNSRNKIIIVLYSWQSYENM
jgi:hypothetical protein